MKFVISRKELVKELKSIQGVVERKNTIPALSHILIEVYKDKIKVLGTDLDNTLSCEIPADVKKEGSFCVSAKKFIDVVNALPDADIKIEVTTNDWVKVECEKSKFKLHGMSKESFPDVQAFKGKSNLFKLNSNELSTLIYKTIFATSQEEGRYSLSGAKFEINGNVKMITTDGHRLAIASYKPTEKMKDLDVMIPRKSLTEIVKMLNGVNEEVDFGVDDSHLFLRVGSRELTSRLLTGTFPNYEMVLPKNNTIKIEVDTAKFNDAIKRAGLMADDRSKCVKFTFEDNLIKLAASSSEEGEAAETVAIDYSGTPIEIGFNNQYIQDILSVIDGETTVISLKDGNTQIEVSSANNKDARWVVMPMRF